MLTRISQKAPILEKEKNCKAHVLIDMTLECKRNLEPALEGLFAKKQKLS